MLVGDLRSCDLLDDWRKIAQDRGAWRCLVKEVLIDLNEHMEVQEEEKKDERKRRRSATKVSGPEVPRNWMCFCRPV